MGMTDILTVKEVAALLKTTCQQVRKLINNEELLSVRVGREWRILMEYPEDYVRGTQAYNAYS